MASAAHISGMPMYRATWTWSGFSGAPGYTNLYFLDPDPISQSGLDQTGARSRTFWAAVAPYLPTGVTVTMPTVLEEITAANGELVAEHVFPGGASVAGSAGGTYHSSSGACVTWHSPFVVNGRKLRGRTFIVPLGNQVFSANGTLSDSIRDSLVAAGNALANAATGIDLAIWHRPTPGLDDGAVAGVSHCTVNDRGAVLRSRRD
jgi:hypothetical protein